MWTLVIVAVMLGLVSTGLVVRPLFSRTGSAPTRSAMDAQVFRDQLDELDRDLQKGVISAAEAEGARIEISRRLLKAAKAAEASSDLAPAPQDVSGLVAGLSLIGVPALAAVVYIGVGAPGVPDQPLAERGAAVGADRPSQVEMEEQLAGEASAPAKIDPDYAALVAQLEATLESRPDDQRGLELYATALMRTERWSEAWRVQERLIGLKAGTATAEHFAQQAEAMVMAAGGYVSPEAEQVIARALQRDSGSHIARYYAGLALAQNGRVSEAVRLWERLRAEAPPDAPWIDWLDMMLAEARERQGGPSEADIAAADGMSPEDRQAMIEGMVQRLETRLTTEGGTVDDWGRLIGSYSALERKEDARRAYELAMAALPDESGKDTLTEYAANLGLTDGQSGPSAADVAAAEQMSPEDRAKMIDGMVSRLEDRLTTEGGEAEDWYRLMNAYVQLDRRDDAARVYALAVEAVPDSISAAFLKEQALLLGLPIE